MLQIKGIMLAGLVLLGVVIGGGSTVAVIRATKPTIKVPDCNCDCPKQEPCNGIDFDKIKSKQVTIQNTQYLTVNGDTLLVEAYVKALQTELSKLRLARCK